MPHPTTIFDEFDDHEADLACANPPDAATLDPDDDALDDCAEAVLRCMGVRPVREGV